MNQKTAAGLVAACLCAVGIAGCASGGAGHSKDQRAMVASTGPTADLNVNSATSQGVMLAWNTAADDWGKAVFLGAGGGTDLTKSAMFDLDHGWVYINGKFPPSHTRWPIVTSHTIKIGATGTKFVVYSVGTTQRVICFEGGVVVSCASFQDEYVTQGNYVEIVSGTTGIGVTKRGPVPTTPTDPVAMFVKTVLDTVHAEPFKADAP